MARILVVDDEPHMRRILATNLQQDGHAVFEAGGVEDAGKKIMSGEYDAVITDQKMPDGTGLDVLRLVQQDDPTVSVVFLTAVGSIELAVESMRGGAFDFLTKPFLPEALRATARRATDHTQLLRENIRLRNAVVRLEGSAEIVGRSAGIQKVREQIARVAATDATVLITGETGTGKELVARAIHKSSSRAAKPFIAVNCAALSESLLESELFGHERGAFTGADRAREGLFEAAHQGTLLLDEIAELSTAAQAKLLRVLTDGQVTRVGSTRPRSVNVRVLAATHRDLEARVRENLFREDLYYRVAIFPIAIPPLRERPEDIPQLCELFLRYVAVELKLPKHRLSKEALDTLLAYQFPGNIRELRNLIERACILVSDEDIGASAIAGSDPGGEKSRKPQAMKSSAEAGEAEWIESLPQSVDLRALFSSIEKKLIERALRSTDGAQAEAARRLGLSRSDLSYKLGKYDSKTAVE
jgi:DNA-binding NtrC family response regulator